MKCDLLHVRQASLIELERIKCRKNWSDNLGAEQLSGTSSVL
jgi:hypothetical protein